MTKIFLEKATLNVILGKEQEFEKNFTRAEKIISKAKGYISHELHKSFNHPNIYLLLVKWQSIEDHKEGFRKSPEYQEWKKLLHHFYDPFPQVQYFELISLNFRLKIRNYQESDAKFLAEIYYNTIHNINIADYTKEQIDAWAPLSSLKELEGWKKKWQQIVPIIAIYDNVIAGFAEFEKIGRAHV